MHLYKNNKIAVVIPAYNEEKLIGRVITTMPDYVDKMVIVDDASSGKTCQLKKSIFINEQHFLFLVHACLMHFVCRQLVSLHP